jgi:8-oxo-dGTP pyrophosphatase MutT (NUDIX family)
MAHIHEKIDFTASVYIVNDGAVLLHKHKKLGGWLPPGGHIELDEDPNEAARREVKEETGLEIELIGNPTAGAKESTMTGELIPPKFLHRHFFDEAHTHEHVDHVYFARSLSRDAVPETADGEIRWVSRKEIEDDSLRIWPDIRMFALKALAELS